MSLAARGSDYMRVDVENAGAFERIHNDILSTLPGVCEFTRVFYPRCPWGSSQAPTLTVKKLASIEQEAAAGHAESRYCAIDPLAYPKFD